MKTTEVVLYKIKQDQIENFDRLTKLADECLSSRNGFIIRIVKNDCKDKSIFMDIVEWESLSDAENAAKEIEKDPKIIPFFEAAEKVISFNHYYQV